MFNEENNMQASSMHRSWYSTTYSGLVHIMILCHRDHTFLVA